MADSPSPESAELRSGRERLADWAKDQQAWVQSIVYDVLHDQGEVDLERTDLIYNTYLVENSLANGPGSGIKEPALAPNTRDEEALRLELIKISDVKNVNGLTMGQSICLKKRMTVLFGENGTGKTGYVRIIKRLADVRGHRAVLTNVFGEGGEDVPEAKVKYRLGSREPVSQAWRGDVGTDPLTRISVFDSHAVSGRVDDELKYWYRPLDLTHFPRTHRRINGIKHRLEQERDRREPKGNPFLAGIPCETEVYRLLEALDPSHQRVADLKRLAKLSETDLAETGRLEAAVHAHHPEAVKDKLKLARSAVGYYRSLVRVADGIRSFDVESWERRLNDLAEAKDRADSDSAQAFAGSEIPALLGDNWRAFIEAAENYVVDFETPGSPYPSSGSNCVYCQQPLTDAALALVQKYRDYCRSAARQAADKASREMSILAEPLNLDIAALKVDTRTQLDHYDPMPAEAPVVLRKAQELLDRAHVWQDAVARLIAVQGAESVDALASEVLIHAGGRLAQAEQDISTLSLKADELEEVRKESIQPLNELKARKMLEELLPGILDHINELDWARKASIRLSAFPALLKSVTEAEKVANARLLNKKFEDQFQGECARLGAPKVSVEYPGRSAETIRHKVLFGARAQGEGLSDVLSEAEQKLVALADFLAETSLRPTSAPIVFDDPVSSLDYRHIRSVADRIAVLSEDQQVVVFTHNIWFAAELLARYEGNPDHCAYYAVEHANDGSPGVVCRASHPRWDSVRKVRGKVNCLIQKAGASCGEERESSIEEAYGWLRNLCEVIVEEELLKGVIKRYEPVVHMTLLKQIKTNLLADAIEAVLPVYTRACRVIPAHSQPLETRGELPRLDDLREDLKKVWDARQAYQQGDLYPVPQTPEATSGPSVESPHSTGCEPLGGHPPDEPGGAM